MRELTDDQIDDIFEGLEHFAPIYMARAAIAADRALNAPEHLARTNSEFIKVRAQLDAEWTALKNLGGTAPTPPAEQPPFQFPKDLHPNTANLVKRFAEALAEKLRKAELKYGYNDGWEANDWMDECRAKLMQHIAKGDPLDVAAYCAFLWHHGESTKPAKIDDVNYWQGRAHAAERKLAELRAKVEALPNMTAYDRWCRKDEVLAEIDKLGGGV